MCILTADVGTTSVKVCLFDGDLKLLRAAALEYALDYAPGGIVEADPAVYLNAVGEGIRRVLAGGPSAPVAAISVTTQGETLIPVDDSGRPLCNAIVWLDSRAQEEAKELAAWIDGGLFYSTTGLPEIGPGLPLAKLMHIRRKQTELYARTHKFLLLEDYILFWLTGRFVTEKSLLCSTGYFNIIEDRYWDAALEAAGIDPAKLPQALLCGEPVGPLTGQRAAELGLSPGTLAVSGAMDQTAAALGSGCVREGIVTETTGTALVVAAHTARPRFTDPSRVTVYRHAIDGAYLYLPIGVTAGMTLKWFRDRFCQDIAPAGDGSYGGMTALAAQVPPGSCGLLALPHLAGCVNPDWNPDARLVFFGASLDTERGHFIRAILESVAYMLRDFTAMLGGLGIGVAEIRSLGGGARSELWEQIKADVTGVPLCTMDMPEAASAGAAVLAAWALGLVPRGSAPPVMKPAKRYQPQQANKETYEHGYCRYRELYKALKPLFQTNGGNTDA